MAIFRCKMCGGDLEVIEGSSACTCEFCGTKQTLPTITDEALQSLFNRANVLRMKSEFDKASDVYEKILQRSETEAEAYWGLILCKYGIEYVEDPATFKRVPTCHRASYDAVTSDEDYKNAIRYADAQQRAIYEAEAAAIDEIQRGIIVLAQEEDPYDVFICYKETDENGKRTQDSVIANDIYHQLTMEGFKVFYAAITLEDKLGKEYEPYIFSALNTAKVMLALGTKPEYFNAVWVKNEWSRFLKIMKKDRSRLLIPCYRDMDPYELPEEFAHLQAQDMSKIGFISDLTRGIRKVLVKEQEQPPVQEKVIVQQSASVSGTTAAAQIKRGNMALEDYEWEKAVSFFEEALNLEPECAEAYLGKLLARERKPDFASWVAMQKEEYISASAERLEACPEEKVHIGKMAEQYSLKGYLTEDKIRNQYSFDRAYYSELTSRKNQKTKQLAELTSERLLARAQQYADGSTRKQLEDAIAEITGVLDQRIAAAKEEDEASIARVKAAYDAHIAAADKKTEELNADALSRQEQDYQSAVSTMKNAKSIFVYEKAKKALKALNGYKDSEALADKCQKEIDRLNEEKLQEQERRAAIQREAAARVAKKWKTITAIAAAIAVVCIAVFFVVTEVIIPRQKLNEAMNLLDSGDYDSAYMLLEEIGNTDAIASNKYDRAIKLIDSGDYNSAYALLEETGNTDAIASNKYDRAIKLIDSGDYEPAYALLEEIGNTEAIASSKYDRAIKLIDSGDYDSAFMLLYGLEYKDSDKKANEILAEHPNYKFRFAAIGEIVTFGAYEQDNNTSNGKEDIEWLVLAKEDNKILIISKYALDCKPYNSELTDVTWENCSLRKWMNGTFLNNAFSAEEQAQILSTKVSADKNPKYSTNPGNATTDKVFLLSITEAEKYFTTDESRKCAPTAYAKGQGASTSDSYKTASGEATFWWWLRSPGDRQDRAADVASDGRASRIGYAVYNINHGDRPALWINLDS